MSADFEARWIDRVNDALKKLQEHLVVCARDKMKTHILLVLLVALMIDGNYGVIARVASALGLG